MSEGSNSSVKLYVERAVRIEEEKRANTEDLRELFKEAKSNGYDPAALRVLVKEAMEDADKRRKREEREAIIETYRAAIGQLDGTPLGNAAMAGV